MAWSPRFIDRPLRLIFDPEVWAVSAVLMEILILCDVNQTLSIGIMFVFGWLVQKVVDRNRKGYILHFLYALGILRFFGMLLPFPPYGRYRF